jgi:hypothetical protein
VEIYLGLSLCLRNFFSSKDPYFNVNATWQNYAKIKLFQNENLPSPLFKTKIQSMRKIQQLQLNVNKLAE